MVVQGSIVMWLCRADAKQDLEEAKAAAEEAVADLNEKLEQAQQDMLDAREQRKLWQRLQRQCIEAALAEHWGRRVLPWLSLRRDGQVR